MATAHSGVSRPTTRNRHHTTRPTHQGGRRDVEIAHQTRPQGASPHRPTTVLAGRSWSTSAATAIVRRLTTGARPTATTFRQNRPPTPPAGSRRSVATCRPACRPDTAPPSMLPRSIRRDCRGTPGHDPLPPSVRPGLPARTDHPPTRRLGRSVRADRPDRLHERSRPRPRHPRVAAADGGIAEFRPADRLSRPTRSAVFAAGARAEAPCRRPSRRRTADVRERGTRAVPAGRTRHSEMGGRTYRDDRLPVATSVMHRRHPAHIRIGHRRTSPRGRTGGDVADCSHWSPEPAVRRRRPCAAPANVELPTGSRSYREIYSLATNRFRAYRRSA